MDNDTGLAHFLFEWNKRDSIRIKKDSLKASPYIYDEGENKVFILGSPVIGEKIARYEAARRFAFSKDKKEYLATLNGEFLLILSDKKNGKIMIANDRFSSIPLYYAVADDAFIGSVYYSDIWNELLRRGQITLNYEAIYEFMHLQRLLGEKTYDTSSRFLSSSSLLIFEGRKIFLERYWRPHFRKDYSISLNEGGRLLAEGVKRSVARKTSEPRKYGHFLSGGIDSRTVLAAFDRPPVCFTLGSSHENNEYLVAREAAAIKGGAHVLLMRPDDHYRKMLDSSRILSGGMYVFDHAFFLGFDDMVRPLADCVFHGHAFDYLFQGMYLPVRHLSIFSKKTHYVRLRKLASDIAGEYISSIPFRLKGVELSDFVKHDFKAMMKEKLYGSVRRILEEGRSCCGSPYDFWDFMIINNLSRHYTHTNYSCFATYAEERKASFDNEILELYLIFPERIRLGGMVLGKALHHLNPSLARLRTGNTNVAAASSPLKKTVMMGIYLAAKRLNIRYKRFFYPRPEDRTWLDRDDVIAMDPLIRSELERISKGCALERLPFLDMDAVTRCIDSALGGERGKGAFIFTLLTLNKFLEA